MTTESKIQEIKNFITFLQTKTGKYSIDYTPDDSGASQVKINFNLTSSNKAEFQKKLGEVLAAAAAALSPTAAAPALSPSELPKYQKMEAEYKSKKDDLLRFNFPDNTFIDVPKSDAINDSTRLQLVIKINQITNKNLVEYIKKNNIKKADGGELETGDVTTMNKVLNRTDTDADNVRLLHKLFNKPHGGVVSATGSSATGSSATGSSAAYVSMFSSGGAVKSMTGGALSLLQILSNIDSNIKIFEKKIEELTTEYGSTSIDPKKKSEIELEIIRITANLSNLISQKEAIMKNLKPLYSSRSKASLSDTDTYKINEDEFLINKSVEALKKNEDYNITEPNGTVIKKISSFSDLRDYIIKNTSDPVTLLLKLTDIHPISLNDYLPAIVEDTFTVKLNDKGILVVKNNDEEIEMPNPSGNKHNRKAYSTKFKSNKCYGFGGPQSNEFCVSLLNNCLASDKDSLEKCKNLFARSDWENVIDEGIQNTNIFFIKEFLLKIGYPRNNNKFDSNIDSWFKVIKSRYDITDTAMLRNIENNDKLKQAITGMVTKYNKIIEMERKSNSTSSRNFHLPMKGGDNMSIINSNLYELYGGLNQNVVNLPSLSPSQKVYNIFKELVKDQDITSKYRNFFDKMEKNIHNQNHDIDPGVRENFNVLLTSFKQSEEKLNKLLQTMHNFAWFLGQTVNTSNLSDADKKTNEEAADRLNKVLNEENINAYNAAREKLVNSLNKKSQKLISIAAGHPVILIASS